MVYRIDMYLYSMFTLLSDKTQTTYKYMCTSYHFHFPWYFNSTIASHINIVWLKILLPPRGEQVATMFLNVLDFKRDCLFLNVFDFYYCIPHKHYLAQNPTSTSSWWARGNNVNI